VSYQTTKGESPDPKAALLSELIKRQLGHLPHAVAVEYGEHKLSWRKLDVRIRHAASGLRAAMIRPGERFAVLTRNHPACIEVLFAAALTGTTAVIVDWTLPEATILEILRGQEVKLLFAGADLEDLLERIRPQLDSLDSVVMVGSPTDNPQGSDDYENWLETHETSEGMYEASKYHPHGDDPVVHAHPADGAEHIALTQRGLYDEIEALTGAPADTIILELPLFLVSGILETLHAMRHGSRTILMRR
jgi:acyl-CoA synthetase (AMP-forming)/AMP-acid ligase II